MFLYFKRNRKTYCDYVLKNTHFQNMSKPILKHTNQSTWNQLRVCRFKQNLYCGLNKIGKILVRVYLLLVAATESYGLHSYIWVTYSYSYRFRCNNIIYFFFFTVESDK